MGTIQLMAAKDVAALAVERESFEPHGCAVRARGQIDLYSAPVFKTALLGALDEGVTDLVVDLTEVDFMDSTALGVLVGVSKRLRQAGGTLEVLTGNDTIRRVFELVGLSDHFNVPRPGS